MATNTTRLGIRRVTGTDLFKPYTVDLPSIVDTIDAKAVQFRSALASVQVRDTGEAGQLRAGRVLAPADFTRMGLAAPLGLWNLGDVNDASGAARTLTNKGAVPFGPGIMGAATEAAIFAGSTGQALYIADIGTPADPFRIRSGTIGPIWFRTAKRATAQTLIAKWGVAAQSVFLLEITTGNVVSGSISTTGSDQLTVTGTADVCDDRWHQAALVSDGTRLRLYVDAALDAGPGAGGVIFGGSSPLDFGLRSADATNTVAGTNAHYGRLDEGVITSDALSPEEIFNLYCARVAHTLADGSGAALAPTGARIGIRRQRRGGVLASGNFPAQPVRLHNFTAGALTDAGSGAVALTSNPGTGAIVTVAAPDGVRDGAYSFSGAHTGLSSTDTGLPAALVARSYGAWFKGTAAALATIIGWGTITTADARISISATGLLQSMSGADVISGPNVIDGLWHRADVVEDNAAADGVKRKLYLDGRLVGGSTVLTSLTLAGANRFRVGAAPDGTVPFTGQGDGAWVYSGALTPEQVRAVYNVGTLPLAASPKAEGDHVEALESSGLLAHFDALEGCDLVDMSVVG